MKQLVAGVVRARLRLMTREAARRSVARALEGYLEIAESLTEDEGRHVVRVPRMIGVDEDMREWSFFMICEHNVIVNWALGASACALARNEPPPPELGRFSPKRDVMPRANAGPEQVTALRESVEDYLERERSLPELRGTRTRPHPLFGEFDAHMWHAMMGFHLELHLRQARAVRRLVEKGR